MKASICCFAVLLGTLGLAGEVAAAEQNAMPDPDHPVTHSKTVFIKKYARDNDGNFHIIYSDGRDIEIQKERGRNSDGEQVLPQVSFSNVKVANDGQHIGWIANYDSCAQSYPCAKELAIFHAGFPITYISPPSGIVWDWMFVKDGDQVAIHYGFPHGDESGAYSLHDTKDGKVLNRVFERDNNSPAWVQNFDITK